MAKTSKFEKYCLKLDKNNSNSETLYEIMDKFEKLYSGTISEKSIDSSVFKIEKEHGISFFEEDNGKEKEIGTVSFSNLVDYKKFCEMFEEGTTTFDEKCLPTLKYNNIADPYPFFSYSIDGKNYSHITREEFKLRFPEYPLGNVDAKPVIRCVYGDLSDVDDEMDRLYMHDNLEIIYYGYDERDNIKPGYAAAEFGFLITIAGNQVFVYEQEEVKELLNSLCLGEEDLCEECTPVKKLDYSKDSYYI